MSIHVPAPRSSLSGLRVLIPRAGDLGAALHEKILARGGVPTIAPLIETVPPRDPDAFAAAVARWNNGEYDWIVTTSANTAQALAAASALPQPHARTAAVGPVTAAAMQELGFRVHVIPGRDFSADGLAASLRAALPTAQPAGAPNPGEGARPVRILFPVSELADTRLEQALRDAGHEVDRVGAYSTALAPEIPGLREEVAAGQFDVLLVTSGSAARAIAERLAPLPQGTLLAAIGRPTAGALDRAGLRADIVADLSTTDGLLDAVGAELRPAPTVRRSITQRPRRLRRTPALRRLVAETRVHPAELILPVFVREGLTSPRPIAAMPGVVQHTLDSVRDVASQAAEAGLGGIMLFGVPEHRDARGSGADSPRGILNRALTAVRGEVGGELVVQADLCLDEFTDHGHCGVLDAVGAVDNDATLERYCAMALAQARAGADLLGLSGMMDGQVAAVREALDRAGHTDTAILAYAAKYASAFYGPFREAVDSQLSGHRRSYQQDPANLREGLREARLDIAEGADIVMVKPAMSYLDVLAGVAAQSAVPVWAYQVSGEVAMIEAAAANGWIDREAAILESVVSIRRAGADAVLSYFALEMAGWLR